MIYQCSRCCRLRNLSPPPSYGGGGPVGPEGDRTRSVDDFMFARQEVLKRPIHRLIRGWKYLDRSGPPPPFGHLPHMMQGCPGKSRAKSGRALWLDRLLAG